jgi:hypothetical protein
VRHILMPHALNRKGHRLVTLPLLGLLCSSEVQTGFALPVRSITADSEHVGRTDVIRSLPAPASRQGFTTMLIFVDAPDLPSLSFIWR